MFGRFKKECHAEALERCQSELVEDMCVGHRELCIAIMHGVKAFARILRVPQYDTLRDIYVKT